MHPYHENLDTLNSYLKTRVQYYDDCPKQAFTNLSEALTETVDTLHDDCRTQDDVDQAYQEGESNLGYAREIFSKTNALFLDALKCPESGDLTLTKETVMTMLKSLSKLEAALA
jgi:hypothetical protein